MASSAGVAHTRACALAAHTPGVVVVGVAAARETQHPAVCEGIHRGMLLGVASGFRRPATIGTDTINTDHGSNVSRG